MLANMVTSLFDKERIKTTDAKAKEARRQAERLITRAKKGYSAYQEHQSLKDAGKEAESRQMQAVALAHWRRAGRVVKKQSVLKKLFDVIAPQFLERNGGYTRILHLQHRQGDNAREVLLELVGVSEKHAETAESEKGKKKGKKAAAEKAPEGAVKKKRDKKSEKLKASKEEAKTAEESVPEKAPAEEVPAKDSTKEPSEGDKQDS
jgi:large subunit ribosomal protein L17